MQAKTILKTIRTQDKKISLSVMAKALNIGISRYFMIETGERPATPEIADQIAVILETPMDVIFLPQSFTVRKVDDQEAVSLDSTGTEGR